LAATNTRLFLWLKERLAVRQARGILLWHFVAATSGGLRRTRCARRLVAVLVLDANEARVMRYVSQRAFKRSWNL